MRNLFLLFIAFFTFNALSQVPAYRFSCGETTYNTFDTDGKVGFEVDLSTYQGESIDLNFNVAKTSKKVRAYKYCDKPSVILSQKVELINMQNTIEVKLDSGSFQKPVLPTLKFTDKYLSTVVHKQTFEMYEVLIHINKKLIKTIIEEDSKTEVYKTIIEVAFNDKFVKDIKSVSLDEDFGEVRYKLDYSAIDFLQSGIEMTYSLGLIKSRRGRSKEIYVEDSSLKIENDELVLKSNTFEKLKRRSTYKLDITFHMNRWYLVSGSNEMTLSAIIKN